MSASANDIIASTCAAYGVSLRDFFPVVRSCEHCGAEWRGAMKKRPIPACRRDVFSELRRHGLSLPQIGEACGVGHTAVLKSLQVQGELEL